TSVRPTASNRKRSTGTCRGSVIAIPLAKSAKAPFVVRLPGVLPSSFAHPPVWKGREEVGPPLAALGPDPVEERPAFDQGRVAELRQLPAGCHCLGDLGHDVE